MNVISSEIIMNEAKSVTILRGGDTMELPIPTGFISLLSKARFEGFVSPRYPQIVDSVPPGVEVLQGNVRKGDTLIGVNGHFITFASDLGKDTTFNFERGLKQLTYSFRRGK